LQNKNPVLAQIQLPIRAAGEQFARVRVGALTSAHIFGTLVPVEEPSTASKADVGSAPVGNFADLLDKAIERRTIKVIEHVPVPEEKRAPVPTHDPAEMKGNFPKLR
jgi:hypothetical protein